MAVPVGLRANLCSRSPPAASTSCMGTSPDSRASPTWRFARLGSRRRDLSLGRAARIPPGEKQRERLLGRIDALTATRPAVATAAAVRFPGDYEVLPLGIDPELFRPGRLGGGSSSSGAGRAPALRQPSAHCWAPGLGARRAPNARSSGDPTFPGRSGSVCSSARRGRGQGRGSSPERRASFRRFAASNGSRRGTGSRRSARRAARRRRAARARRCRDRPTSRG